jgi:hypothetical protein
VDKQRDTLDTNKANCLSRAQNKEWSIKKAGEQGKNKGKQGGGSNPLANTLQHRGFYSQLSQVVALQRVRFLLNSAKDDGRTNS